jgi:hypothetical protein
LSNDEQESEVSKLEMQSDDRYSSRRDPRFRSKRLKGWRVVLWSFTDKEWWESYKSSLGSNLGPWPMPLLIVILVCLYFIRKYFETN